MTLFIFILIIHISIALALCLSLLSVLYAAVHSTPSIAHDSMRVSFMGVIFTGGGLMLMSAASLGRFCAMMTVFTLLTVFIDRYYKKRIGMSQAL